MLVLSDGPVFVARTSNTAVPPRATVAGLVMSRVTFVVGPP
jgi:hypothetical protein